MPQQAVFIDRDGTINEDKGYVHRIEDFQLIPGALEALRNLTLRGISIYIITNQSGIGRGYYTEEQFHLFNSRMLKLLSEEGVVICDVLYCPHYPKAVVEAYRKACDCRKPANSLVKGILDKNSFKKAAVIGDRNGDIETGLSLNLLTYLVQTGHGQNESQVTRAHFVVPNLASAVRHLLEMWEMKLS